MKLSRWMRYGKCSVCVMSSDLRMFSQCRSGGIYPVEYDEQVSECKPGNKSHRVSHSSVRSVRLWQGYCALDLRWERTRCHENTLSRSLINNKCGETLSNWQTPKGSISSSVNPEVSQEVLESLLLLLPVVSEQRNPT